MARYEVLLRDRSVEIIDDAHAYAQEGTMTTFFCLADGRDCVDRWSTRVASFRTVDLLMVRRRSDLAAQAQGT